MTPLNMDKMVIFPPVLLNNQNLKVAFELYEGEMTRPRAEAFISSQAANTYRRFEHFASPYVGQLWSVSDEQSYARMIAAFVDKSNRICVTLLDNDPAVPADERGFNLLLVSTGYDGKKPSVALLSKNDRLILAFSSIFPGRPMIDETIFSQPIYLPYQQQKDVMGHLASGHTVGKTCQRCNSKEHQQTPSGAGFGSGR